MCGQTPWTRKWLLHFEDRGEPKPEPGLQASAWRRLHSRCGAWAQECVLSIISSLGPHRCLSLPASQHIHISISLQTQLVGMWYTVQFLMWAFWSLVLYISALSCSSKPHRLIRHIHPYREMQQKPLASAVFWALYTHTGSLFSLVCNLWIWDVLAKSSWCLGDIHWRKSKYNCPVLWSQAVPYLHVPGACAELSHRGVLFST